MAQDGSTDDAGSSPAAAGAEQDPAWADEVGEGPAHAALSLSFDEDSNVLYASVVPADESALLDLDGLRQLIDAHGFGDFHFQPDALEGLMRRLNGAEYGDVAIATRVDAGITVSVSADGLTALLTTSPAWGGVPVTEGRIREALAAEEISEELIIGRAVAEAAGQREVKDLVVARGVPPEPGIDSRTELLVDLECEVSRPREDEHGNVDHYSVREFLVVEAGTPLLRKYPPTRAVAGRDVYGKAISAPDGKDIPYPKDMTGVRAAGDDPEVMVADYKGHPVAIPGGIRVDKTLPLDFVDLRTGNIHFDGSVLVANDVAAGVTIIASGDITVKGTVENAFLEAGGDLVVGRGITGSEVAMNGGQREVMLEAGGSIHAAFASGVRLRAGQDLVVKEYLNHCDSYAAGQVLVGQSGGHGVIVGGTCHGCQGIAARVIGSHANVRTRVKVGVHEELRRSQREALDERRALKDRLEQLNTMLASMQEDHVDGDGRDNLIEKVSRTIQDFERRTAEVNGCIDAIAERIASSEAAAVVSDQRVFPGTLVEIGDAVLPLRSESPGTRFVCRAGEIQTA